MIGVKQIVIGVAVIGAIGSSYYFLITELHARAEELGALESENTQLVATLESQKQETLQVRSEMTLWRDLYTDLQGDFETVLAEREAANQELVKLRRKPDVKAYLECPMPDDLYQWLRQN